MADINQPTTLVHASSSVRMGKSHIGSRHIPPPGFSSIAIPLPARSLYLRPDLTRPPAPGTSPASLDGAETVRGGPLGQLKTKTEPNRAYTLLIVDDNPVQRKLLSKVCAKFGQPYELAENGEQAVYMYKSDPAKFRGILMDTLMPVLDGFEATRQIRAFEEESWRSYSPLLSASSSSHPPSGSRNPVRRAVIIAMVPWHYIDGLWERIVGAGFDLSLSHPLHLGHLADLLFSGPCINVIALYGGVDKEKLSETGYPLQIRSLGSSRNEDKEVGEVVGCVIV